VLELGERYSSLRGTWIKIADRSAGRMSFERDYAEHAGRADPHNHLDFTQTWEVLSGAVRLRAQPAVAPTVAKQLPWAAAV
jgi:hypothetical protein